MKAIVEMTITLRAQVEVHEHPFREELCAKGTPISVTPLFQPRLEFVGPGQFPEKNRAEIRQMMVDMLREAEWV